MNALAVLTALLLAALPTVATAGAPAPLPQRLTDTGLYEPGSVTRVRAGVIAFTPQYGLWSDGAHKRRWIWLPPGDAIDASRPDAWQFPVGTRLWKEFAMGARVETRYIERLPGGSWRYASYRWNADGSDATLVPDAGAAVAVSAAPGGRYMIPSRGDCAVCHEGTAVPVLGFSALQLSPDRDPLGLHAGGAPGEQADLRNLVARRLVVNLPPALLTTPPRIAARSPIERAALGYLHANCGHCHNPTGVLDGLELTLAQRAADGGDSAAATLRSLLGHASRFVPQGGSTAQRVAAVGDAAPGTLLLRLTSTDAATRMPPLGVQRVDAAGAALIELWLSQARQPTVTEP